MSKSRLNEIYETEIRPQLLKELNLSNIMEVPKIEKIVLNVGVKDAVDDSKAIQLVVDGITKITGQKAVKTKAKKSIANFKIREGMDIGVKVTLRKDRMYEFLDRFINLALPTVRDFNGVKTSLDGQGNYSVGIKEWSIFPEIDFNTFEKIYGLNITIHTSTKSDKYAYELLKKFKMPFRKSSK